MTADQLLGANWRLPAARALRRLLGRHARRRWSTLAWRGRTTILYFPLIVCFGVMPLGLMLKLSQWALRARAMAEPHATQKGLVFFACGLGGTPALASLSAIQRFLNLFLALAFVHYLLSAMMQLGEPPPQIVKRYLLYRGRPRLLGNYIDPSVT